VGRKANTARRAEESTESNIRYAAYASRARTILLSAHRYVAYTSDIGESFRPIAHPFLVRGAYGVSWAYLIGDVGHEGYKAYIRNQRSLHPELHTEKDTDESKSAEKTGKVAGALGKMGEGLGVVKGKDNPVTTGGEGDVVPGRVSAIQDYRTVMAQRAIFQGAASMGFPAFTIHSIVRYSGQALKNAANKNIRVWAPIGVSHPCLTSCNLDVLTSSSSVSQLFLHYPTCSMHRLSMGRSGYFTMGSRHSEVRKQLRVKRHRSGMDGLATVIMATRCRVKRRSYRYIMKAKSRDA
jgi:hypothetical protein